MRGSLVALGLAAVACGGSGSGNPADSIQAMEAVAHDISSATDTYGAQAAGMADVTACASDEASHDAQVRPMVERMQGLSPGMDGMMGSLGDRAEADMTCAADAMMYELDRHQGVACSSPADMGPNKAEAAQHVENMTKWADHQTVRASDLASMVGMGGRGGGMGGGMGGGTTGHCVHNSDGSYSME